jgi:hypothetical protein
VYLPVVSRHAEVQHLAYTIAGQGAFDPINTEPHGLALTRGVLFAGMGSGAGGRHWIASLDVSQPSNIVEIGRLAGLAGPAVQLVPAGTQLVAALGEAGVAVLDIADPRAPRVLGTIKADHAITRVAVSGDMLAALDISPSGHTTLRTFRFADPAALTEVGRLELQDSIGTDIEVRGERLYISTPEGLAIAQMSRDSDPSLLQLFGLRGLGDAALADDLLYAVNVGETTQTGFPGGLWVLDPQRETPAEVGSLVSIDWPEVLGGRRVSLSGTWALSSTEDGLRVVDVSLSGWPRLLTEQEGGYSAIQDALLAGRRIYVSDTGAGVVILDVTAAPPR